MTPGSIQAEAEGLLAGNEHDIDSVQVLALVRETDCSAYDCEFVALAMRLGAKLVTSDAQLLRGFPDYITALVNAVPASR